jgi:sugar lactone lactonase YvrE
MESRRRRSFYRRLQLNSTDFIGISDAAISDTASGSVTIKGGISTNVTGLTANALYYVKKSGGLTPTTTYATSGYNLDGATYTSTYNVSAQSVADEVRFNPSGTKMFVLGYDQVFQYSLSTAFDTATASYDSVVFSVSSQDTQAIGLAFNNDGTKMYMSGNQTDSVYQYSLSVGFDMSTASYDSVSLSVTAQETSPESLAFNDDGTKMYIVGQNSDTVFQYSLSSAFDLSTASYDSISLSVSGQESGPTGIAFSGDGTKMFIVGYPTDTVYQYGLTSAWDLSTASYSSISFSVSSQDSAPKGVTFSTDGTIMYIAGSASSGTIHQYSTAVTDTTTVLAGKALSSTSINLDYTT